MVKLFALLICTGIFASTAAADPSISFAKQADASCRKISTSAVDSFQSVNGFSFEQAVVTVYGTKAFKAIYDPNIGFDTKFCNSFIGEKWGRIKFSTNAKKPSIYVQGTLKKFEPNAEKSIMVGLYAVKMVVGKKQCYGDAEVTENQLKVFHCDF